MQRKKEFFKKAHFVKPYGAEKRNNSKYADGLFVCPHCGKVSEYNQKIVTSNKDTTNNTRSELTYFDYWAERENGKCVFVHECKSCGNLSAAYEEDATEDIPYYPQLVLSNYPCSGEHFKTSEQVLYDEEQGKLWIYASYVNVFITNNHVSYEPFYYKFILDLKNHTSWFYGPVTFKRKRAFGSNDNVIIKNCTYGKWYLDTHIFSLEGIKTMLNFFQTVTQYPDNVVNKLNEENREYVYKDNAIGYMTWMNSCPNIVYKYSSYTNKYEISNNSYISNLDFTNYRRYNYYDGSLFKDFSRTIEDTESFIKRIVDKYNLPCSKKFKSLYMSDIKWLAQCVFFKKLGFENVDILQSLFTMNALERNTIDTGFDLFVKHLVKNCGEHIASKKLLKILNSENPNYYECTFLRDACSMYHSIYKFDKSLLLAVDWGRSIKQIHDVLSKLHTKIQFENKTIPYKESDLELAGTINDCEFELPADTNRLIEVGSLLGNCVGSYRDSVLARNSIIVFMKQSEKVIACIELSKTRGLKQVSAKYNNPVSIEYKPAFDKWAKRNNIKDIDCCYDYVNFGKEENRSHDYHLYDIDENGDVVMIQEKDEMPF